TDGRVDGVRRRRTAAPSPERAAAASVRSAAAGSGGALRVVSPAPPPPPPSQPAPSASSASSRIAWRLRIERGGYPQRRRKPIRNARRTERHENDTDRIPPCTARVVRDRGRLGRRHAAR